MRKGDLIRLLNQYNRNRWFLAKENLHVALLKCYLLLNSIRNLSEDDNISFHEFNRFILTCFPGEDLTQLFTQDYLTGTANSATLFRAFIAAEEPTAISEEKPPSEIMPKPKTVIKHEKESKITPDKTREFSQSAFIRKANIISYLKFKERVLKGSGICDALTLIWYDYLNSDRDLIAELSKPRQNPILLKRIQDTQDNLGTAGRPVDLEAKFKDIQEKIALLKRIASKEYLEQTREKDKKMFSSTDKANATQGYMSLLEFNEGLEQSMRFSKFEDYLDKLKDQGRSEQGLHTISVNSLGSAHGHIVGWTYKNNQYILFDSNRGESYFTDFGKFKAYLCDYIHFPTLFPRTSNKTLLVSDFYSDVPRNENKESLTLR